MKLYYWSSVETLAENGDGLAFAHAHSREEAIDLIVGVVSTRPRFERLRKELESTEPIIISEDGVFAEAIVGSA